MSELPQTNTENQVIDLAQVSKRIGIFLTTFLLLFSRGFCLSKGI